MSLVEPSIPREGAAFPDQAERPSGWMSAGIALTVAAVALGFGVAFSAAVVMGGGDDFRPSGGGAPRATARGSDSRRRAA